MGFKGFSEIVYREKHNNRNIYVYTYECIPLLLDSKKLKYIYLHAKANIYGKKREKNFARNFAILWGYPEAALRWK